jgi:hypothetical protein
MEATQPEEERGKLCSITKSELVIGKLPWDANSRFQKRLEARVGKI